MSHPSSRTLTVYGGAGGRGTRISSFSASPRASNLTGGLDLSIDEKATMQNLNNRLAAYLEKVQSLERANAELEQKIRERNENHPDVIFDHTIFLDTIKDLRNKIQLASQGNATLILAVDNAKLVADDYKLKYENELAMHRDVEADLANVRKFLDEFSLKRSDLEMQTEALNEELIILKRNHEEEMSLASVEAGGHLDVCVNAAPSMDLNQAMTEIRQHYEAMTEKSRKELESWYETKTATVQEEMVTQNEDLQNSRIELKELTNALQRLQIELQTHQSMRSALDGDLEETQARYGDLLARLQATVTSLEDQLSQFHANIANNKQEYEMLLDIKTRLECEIAEYRRLLDGDERESHKIVIKTITVVETIEDGKIVESSESVDVNEQND